MKKTLTAIAFAFPLLAASSATLADYQIRIGMETPQGGSLPKGSISFGNGGAVTPPVEPNEPVPEEPSIPQEPEIEGKTFLYKVTLSNPSTVLYSWLYDTRPLTGSPLSCGDTYNPNCFVIASGPGVVAITYMGTDVNYTKNFPVGDSIVVKSGLYNTSTDCFFLSNLTSYIDATTVQIKLAYKCPFDSLPRPAKVESPSTVEPQFTVSFYKNNEE